MGYERHRVSKRALAANFNEPEFVGFDYLILHWSLSKQTCFYFAVKSQVIFISEFSSKEGQAVLVLVEIAEAHEGGRALILRNIRANAARIPARAGVEEAAELIVGDLVVVTTRLTQVLLHVERHLELELDDLDEDLLGDEAFFVGLTTQRDKSLQVLVSIVFLLELEVLLLGEGEHID